MSKVILLSDVEPVSGTVEPKIVYYLELFEKTTDPPANVTPAVRLGPFDKPIQFDYFGDFTPPWNGLNVGRVFVDEVCNIWYQPNNMDENHIVLYQVVRVVAEAVW